jgi:hypothetical protein
LVSLLAFPVFAGAAVPESVISKSEVTVGESLDYIITVRQGEKVSITFPEKRTYLLKEIPGAKSVKPSAGTDAESNENLPAYAIEDISSNEKDGVTEAKLSIRYYAPGVYAMPALKIRDLKGNELPLREISVTVKEINKEGQAADIEDPLDLSGNYTRLILILIGAAAAGALVYAAVRYLRKRRLLKKEPEIPAIEIFRKEIPPIDAGLADGTIDAEEYAVRVSMTVRKLLSKRYSFGAVDMTNTEIVDYLRTLKGDDGWKHAVDDLEQLSMLWDMSKFAEFVPSADLLRVNLKRTAELGERFWVG